MRLPLIKPIIALITLLMFLSSVPAIIFAAEKSYPYKRNLTSGGCAPDKIAITVDNRAKGEQDHTGKIIDESDYGYYCVPQSAYNVSTSASTCNEGFDRKVVVTAGNFWCIPEPGKEGGITNIKCPDGSTTNIDEKGNVIGCFRPITTSNPCSAADRLYDKEDRLLGCKVEPTLVEFGEKDKKIGYGSFQGYDTQIDIPCDPSIAGGTCQQEITTPAQYIVRIYQFGLMIAGLLAFGSIVFGAVQYILSAGNIVNQGEAKDRITQAIVGLLLLLGAYLILFTINPDLVRLRDPGAKILNIEQQGGVSIDGGTGQTITGIERIPGCKVHDFNFISGTFTSKGETNQLFGDGGCRKCEDGFEPAGDSYPTNECIPLEGPVQETGEF